VWPLLVGGLAWYGVRSWRTIRAVQEKYMRIPNLSVRACIILAGCAGVIVAGIYAGVFMLQPNEALAILFALDIAVPALVALCVWVTIPLSTFLKRRIMAAATKKREEFPGLLVIGITGSYAKTSMKEFLAHILSKKFRVHKTPENANTEFAVAREMLKNITPQHEVFIVEMGAYRQGEIAAMCNIVKPHMGILCGLNQQHVALFGGMRQLQQAKYELIQALPQKGLAIFNADNDQCRALYRACKKPKRAYASEYIDGLLPHLMYPAFTSWDERGVRIVVEEQGKKIDLRAPLWGRHNIGNIMGAVSVARELGMTWEEIAQQCKTLSAPPHTLQMKKGIKHSRVLDDSYTANSDGVFAALEVLGACKAQKKICILQPLIELGKNAEAVHARIGEAIGASCDLCIVTSQDYFAALRRGASDAGMKKNSLWCIPDPYIALRKAQELCEEGDMILIENRVPESIVKGLIVE
ncbi:MAG TPA: Mur ligase family protein, partial [Gammaproteobacteria bacterium]|nr:Mur ligase family protein [Gammaproteobacteria bacterium]